MFDNVNLDAVAEALALIAGGGSAGPTAPSPVVVPAAYPAYQPEVIPAAMGPLAGAAAGAAIENVFDLFPDGIPDILGGGATEGRGARTAKGTAQPFIDDEGASPVYYYPVPLTRTRLKEIVHKATAKKRCRPR